MTTISAQVPARTLPLEVVLVLIPAAFVIIGLMARYAAYASVAVEPSLAAFPQGLCRWDCAWYIGISERGYDPFPVPSMITAGNWPFFPLYPLLIGALQELTGLSVMLVATVTSIALTALAGRLAWPLLGRNLRAYVLFNAFILAGPFSIYFTTFYTETMFFLLTICVFVALQQRNYLLAGLFAALVSATRIVGVFIVFAIVLQAYLDHRKDGGTLRSFVVGLPMRPDLLLAIFIAPLGLFFYMAYLHYQIGDALAFSHVQRAWGRVTANPLLHLWVGIAKEGFFPRVSQQLAAAWLVGMGLIGVMVARRHYPAALFSTISLVLPLSAGLASMLRFVVGLAPVVIMMAVLLARRPAIFMLALGVCLIGCYFGTIGWMTGFLTLV